MKKLTLLIMACAMALMSFAAGGNITYVLNGGVANDDGWKDKEDMYQGLYASWNTFKGGGQAVWTPLADLIAANGTAAAAVPLGIPTHAASMDLTFIQDATVKAKWQWLFDYMDAVCTAQGQTLPSTNAAFLRYNLSTFFLNSVRTAWPVSADYAVAGNPEAFIPTWKHAFAGPATYDGSVEVIIPDPYKEGETFGGWFKNADFSGGKVTSIPAGTEGDITLYALWGEYIPTIVEVRELATGTTTKAQGIVTYVNGTTAYMQDATGGLLVEFTSAPDAVAGDRITVSGTTTALGSYVKLTGATVTAKTAASLPAIQTIPLSTLAVDAASYMFEYVKLEGLKITAKGTGNVTLSDYENNNIVFVADVTSPVGTKINVKAVVSYVNSAVALVGNVADVEIAPVPRPEEATYPEIGGKYTLENRWMVSANMYNLSANQVHSASQMVRGMVSKNGNMYFLDSRLEQLTVIDGITGEKLAPIKLKPEIFQTCERPVSSGLYPLNDLKLDSEGHVLLGNGVTSNKMPFQVWKIDLATGNGTLVVSEVLLNNPDYAAMSVRFDAFGVYGDVDGDAIIMAANASGMQLFKWTITNGVAEPAEVVEIETADEGTLLTGLVNPGTAPQVFPLDENYFYLDGNATLPTLIQMDGIVVDGFFNNPSLEGNYWSLNTAHKKVANGNRIGHNGLIEFEVGGEYFFLIASMNTAGSPPSTFELFKWKNANKEFKDLESLWTLPQAGMGTVSNPYRTAVPSVEVNEATKTATLYLYTGENGYGVYEFKIQDGQGVETVYNNQAVNVEKINNRTVTLSKEVASVDVYTVTGQLVSKANKVSSIKIASSGIFIVKATTYEGETAVHKVIVK